MYTHMYKNIRSCLINLINFEVIWEIINTIFYVQICVILTHNMNW